MCRPYPAPFFGAPPVVKNEEEKLSLSSSRAIDGCPPQRRRSPLGVLPVPRLVLDVPMASATLSLGATVAPRAFTLRSGSAAPTTRWAKGSAARVVRVRRGGRAARATSVENAGAEMLEKAAAYTSDLKEMGMTMPLIRRNVAGAKNDLKVGTPAPPHAPRGSLWAKKPPLHQKKKKKNAERSRPVFYVI